MALERYQTIWFRKGRVYLPTIGKTPSGLFYETEPVKVLDPDPSAIAAGLDAALRSAPTAIPDWPQYQGSGGQSVVQIAAGFKSWSAFAKRALGIALIDDGKRWQLSIGEGGAQEDAENVFLDRAASAQQIADAIVAASERRPLWRES